MAGAQNGPICYIDPQSPPSSYAIAGVYEGEPGAWGRVGLVTAQRSLFLAPGLALAGLRGRKLLVASLLASASATVSLLAFYGLRRAKFIQSWTPKGFQGV